MVFEVLISFLDFVIALVGLSMKTANNQPAERRIRHWTGSEIILFLFLGALFLRGKLFGLPSKILLR